MTMKLSAELESVIVDKGNVRLFFDNTAPQLQHRVESIDFNAVSKPDSFGTQQVIMLHTGFPPRKIEKWEIYCLFPNARDHRQRLLASHKYWSITSLNKEINARFAASNDAGTSRFALAFGDRVVSFPGARGTLYLVWAATLTTYNASKTVTKIERNVALLVNMNGEALITGIYQLGAKRSIVLQQDADLRTPIFMGDHAHLWVYEQRPEPIPLSMRIRVMGYEDAVAFSTLPSRNTQEWIGFNDMGETQDCEEVDTENRLEPVYDWRSTPDGMFATSSNTIIAMQYSDGTRLEAPAVSSGSDNDQPPDPFVE
jgi:hypothetical protein